MRRRRRRSRRNTNGTKALIIIAAAGLAIYIVTATAVGELITQKVITPALAKLGGEPVEITPAETPGVQATPIPTESPATMGTTAEIRLDGYTLYALQMGAFGAKANAEREAETLKSRGAAGYVHHDSLYRVLAAVFKTEQEAKTVRDQLKSENGLDSAAYKIEVPAVAIKVIASDEQVAAVQTAFNVFNDAISTLLTLSIDYDSKAVTEEQAREKLRQTALALETPVHILSMGGQTGTDVNTSLESAKTYISDTADVNKTNSIDFQSKIKYNSICVIFEYISMVNKLISPV